MTAPTYNGEFETAWGSATSPKGSGSITAATGDVIVSMAVMENWGGITPLSLTGTGVTLTSYEYIEVAGACALRVSAGTVATGGTVSVSADNAGDSLWFGANTLHFSNSDGIGAAESTYDTGTDTPSISITTTQANSAVLVVLGDYNALADASRDWLSVNGAPTEVTYFTDASHYTVMAALYPDVGAAGAKTVGLNSDSGDTLFSIAAIEIKGTTAGGAEASKTPSKGLLYTC